MAFTNQRGKRLKITKYLEGVFVVTIKAMAIFAGVLLFLLMLTVSVDVIMRYLVKRPMFWVGELVEYALLYITFVGTPWVLKEDGHVKVDILIKRMGSQKRKIFNVIASLIGIFVCVILTYYGLRVTWDNFVRGVCNPTLMEFPKAPLLAIIPIGGFLLIIQFMRNLFQSLKKS